MKGFIKWALWGFWLTLILGAVTPVQGHGGGVIQLFNAEAGAYWVSVWRQPEPLREGTVHLTVAVIQPPPDRSQPEKGTPVLGATVRVIAQPTFGGEVIETMATHEQAVNKFFYETDFEVMQTGMWRFKIVVQGELGEGVTQFEQMVSPKQLFTVPFLIGGVGTILFIGWLIWSRTHRVSQRPLLPPTNRL